MTLPALGFVLPKYVLVAAKILHTELAIEQCAGGRHRLGKDRVEVTDLDVYHPVDAAHWNELYAWLRAQYADVIIELDDYLARRQHGVVR